MYNMLHTHPELGYIDHVEKLYFMEQKVEDATNNPLILKNMDFALHGPVFT